MKGRPTPTPWKLWNGYGPLHDGKYAVRRIGPDAGMFDGLTGSGDADIVGTHDNLEFVIIAVNSHDDLLAAAEAALDLLTSEYQQGINNGYWPNVAPIVHNLEAAIAKAKGR